MSLMIAERPHSVDSERALATLWARAGALRDGLVTQDGSRYRVVYPGRPNPRAGPDFLDARLVTESGEAVIGDVELHLNAPDWYGHGHDSDPNYNGVVLHVVLSARGHSTSSQQSKMQVPVASLEGFLDTLEKSESVEFGHQPSAAPVDVTALEEKLDQAGDERFLSRSKGFVLELSESTPDQVVYRSVMEALGYASNRSPFRRLADIVPYSALAALKDEPRSTRSVAIHAVLLSASGLVSSDEADPETKSLMRLARRRSVAHVTALPRPRPLSREQWNLFRVRPSNHPLARLRGAARLLEAGIGVGLALSLRDALADGGVRGIESTFLFKPFIGKSRARDITVNVALPFLHAIADRTGDRGLSNLAINAYSAVPKMAENEITREMRGLLGLPPNARMSARRQQGLMHLYRSGRRTNHGPGSDAG